MCVSNSLVFFVSIFLYLLFVVVVCFVFFVVLIYMMITLMLWLVCCLVGTRKETLKNLSYITNFALKLFLGGSKI